MLSEIGGVLSGLRVLLVALTSVLFAMVVAVPWAFAAVPKVTGSSYATVGLRADGTCLISGADDDYTSRLEEVELPRFC